MSALVSALTSCRASRVDLRGGSGSAVDKFDCALCVGRGGEHRSVVSSQHFQPGCDIGCVIFARFKSNLQVGTEESGPEFGNQFLDSVTFAPEAMPAEVTVEPGLAACPVGAFMGKRRVITVRVLEALEWRHLDRIGGDAVKRVISAVSDGCAQGLMSVYLRQARVGTPGCSQSAVPLLSLISKRELLKVPARVRAGTPTSKRKAGTQRIWPNKTASLLTSPRVRSSRV